ncbi:hypothetical protein MDAP_000413 [Mitosporidium daphniae]
MPPPEGISPQSQGNSLHQYLKSTVGNDILLSPVKSKRTISTSEDIENDHSSTNVQRRSARISSKTLESFGFSKSKCRSQDSLLAFNKPHDFSSISLLTEQSIDNKIIENKKIDSKSTDNKKIDSKSTDNKKIDSKSTDNKKIDSKSTENKIIEKKSTESKSTESNMHFLDQNKRIAFEDSIFPTKAVSLVESSLDYENSSKLAIINEEKIAKPLLIESEKHKESLAITRFSSQLELTKDQKRCTPELYLAPSREMCKPRLQTLFTDVPTSTLLPKSMLDLEKFYFSLEECGSLNESRGISTIFCRVCRPIELMTGLSIDHFFLQSILYFLPDLLAAEPWVVVHEGRRVLSWIIKGAGAILSPNLGPTAISPSAFVDRRSILRTRLLNELYKNYSLSSPSEEIIELSCIIGSKFWPTPFHPGSLFPSIESLPRKSLPGIQGYPEILGSILDNSSSVFSKTTPSVLPEKTDSHTSLFPAEAKETLSLLGRIRAKEKERNAQLASNLPAANTILVAGLSGRPLLQKLLSLIEGIDSIFMTFSKNVLLLGELSKRLSSNCNINVTPDEACSLVKYLVTIVPKYLSIVKMGGESASGNIPIFIKIHRDCMAAAVAKKEVQSFILSSK